MKNRFEAAEKIKNFLGGTFHLDVDSPEQALKDFLDEATQECIRATLERVTNFLDSDLNEQEKTNFIESYADIYFPAMGMTPVEWLQNVLEQIKAAVNKKDMES